MIGTLLLLLKILGIFILVLLGILLTVLLLVLFVPIRYKITAHRKITEEEPTVAEVKITWLLHIVNVVFSYPKAAYAQVRIFCFKLLRIPSEAKEPSENEELAGAGKKSAKKRKVRPDTQKEAGEEEREAVETKASSASEEPVPAKEASGDEVLSPEKEHGEEGTSDNEAESDDTGEEQEKENKFVEFFRKLLELLRNIRYTIAGFCDKIKDIVNNIQYYMKILQSSAFSGAWAVCSKQALSLLKSIGPRKISGTLLIGTGDPASTGQAMAVYGILYPFIGDKIEVTPDFERQIVEGDLLIKGKITVFMALKAAWIIYFNRDMRRLIKLFKKGGSVNGRK